MPASRRGLATCCPILSRSRTKEDQVMSSTMPVCIETADVLSVALRLRAAKDGVSPEEVVDSILRKALAPEIEEASGELPLATVIQKVMHGERRDT
jgi:plasmid stability protein